MPRTHATIVVTVMMPRIVKWSRCPYRGTRRFTCLGSYTRQVLGALTEQERESMFGELAIGYLDGLAADTAQYETLTRKSREAFWR